MKLVNEFDHKCQSYCELYRLAMNKINKTKEQSIYFAYPICNNGDKSAYIIIENKKESGKIKFYVFLCKEKCKFEYDKDLKVNIVVNRNNIINDNINEAKTYVEKRMTRISN